MVIIIIIIIMLSNGYHLLRVFTLESVLGTVGFVRHIDSGCVDSYYCTVVLFFLESLLSC